jgi:hypothetical protein
MSIALKPRSCMSLFSSIQENVNVDFSYSLYFRAAYLVVIFFTHSLLSTAIAVVNETMLAYGPQVAIISSQLAGCSLAQTQHFATQSRRRRCHYYKCRLASGVNVSYVQIVHQASGSMLYGTCNNHVGKLS